MISITNKTDLMSMTTLCCIGAANAMLVRVGDVYGLESSVLESLESSGLESNDLEYGIGLVWEQASQDINDYGSISYESNASEKNDYTNLIDKNREDEIYTVDTLDILGLDARVSTFDATTFESVTSPEIKKPKKVFVRY